MSDPSAIDRDTIVALSSGSPPCGIAVVRISGSKAASICQRLTGTLPRPRRASLLTVNAPDGQPIDTAIVVYYVAPHSYTGEDVLEIQVHGSMPVVGSLIHAICAHDARHARPGEFTERAFFNRRIDLVQAEAVSDLISAQTQRAAQAAHNTLRGAYSQRIRDVQDKLTQLRVSIEGNIDFPEEDLETESADTYGKQMDQLLAQIEVIKRQTENAIARGQCLQVVLIGEPNVGKSSFINAISEQDAAIVSPIPGTTRDAISVELSIDGWQLSVNDTAGLREGGDQIEQEGIKRARRLAEKADRIWWIRAPDAEEQISHHAALRQRLGLASDSPIPIDVINNKIDLTDHRPDLMQQKQGFQLWLSCKTGVGLDQVERLIQTVYQTTEMIGEAESHYSARRRHCDALIRVHGCLREARARCGGQFDWELIAEHLRQAQSHLDEILGVISSDNLLGEIFSQFCIGK